LTAGRQEHAALSDGSDYGYWLGGRDGLGSADEVDTVERITFSTGVTAVFGNTLSQARVFMAASSDNGTYGYVLGGESYSPTVYYDDADRVVYSTGAIAANAVSDLSEARGRPGGLSDNVTYGYATGGRNAVGQRVTTDKLTFTTGVTAANAASNLSAARDMYHVGVSDGAV